MAALTLDDVRHVANLAALELDDRDPEELEALRAELSAILEFMADLDAVDVTGVEPTAHPFPMASPLRPDEVLDVVPRERLMAAAPRTQDGAFAVPKVLEGDS
ncbi:MAG: Asp-tRNA(Asn)/Glu-tRNA(Gln) amidotransferase subunit GatC [Myxococcales bacterium]|nr:Asp-tRNA(Asn)/Glu-tRNA(Gln) amidotransferase subunit GatC [Myxococcales bacterium]